MHLFFYVRGISQQIEMWKGFSQFHFWKWKRRDMKKRIDFSRLTDDALKDALNRKNIIIEPYNRDKALDELAMEEILVQGALRTSILGAYEYVFPEECLSEVLAVFGITDYENYENSFKRKAEMWFLRKAFDCEDIPQENVEEAKSIPTTIILNDRMRGLTNSIMNGIVIHPIGIKKDRFQEAWGYYQEML